MEERYWALLSHNGGIRFGALDPTGDGAADETKPDKGNSRVCHHGFVNSFLLIVCMVLIRSSVHQTGQRSETADRQTGHIPDMDELPP